MIQESIVVPQKKVDLLKSKQHFEILDGLRGIAAVAVVIFHFMEIAVPDYSNNFIAHSYLAVDFFFCLSGFVIAYSYDNRLQKIGVLSFIKLRLIRLHPLVVLGSLIGLLAFIFDPFSNLWQSYSNKIFLMFICSCLMVPYPLVPERYFNLFHLNPPTWSLFWEYVINIVYALVLVRLRKKTLQVLTIIAAVALCYEAYKSDYLGVGWGGDSFWGGLVRVSYSFLAGILLYRLKWIIKSNLGFISISILTCLAFIFPYVKNYNFIIDPLIAIFYFPFMVALGAGSHLRTGLKKICRFSGEISYPLYMVHYPFIWLFMSYTEKAKPTLNEMTIIIIAGTILLIAFAYFVLVCIDTPIRKILKGKMK